VEQCKQGGWMTFEFPRSFKNQGECRLQGINLEEWPTFYEKQTGKILVTNLHPGWLIFSDRFVKTDTTRMVKRAIDIALALGGLASSIPLMVVVACLIKLTSKGPLLSREQRVGERGQIFTIYKFRTTEVADEQGREAPLLQATRVTRVGRWLRRTR